MEQKQPVFAASVAAADTGRQDAGVLSQPSSATFISNSNMASGVGVSRATRGDPSAGPEAVMEQQEAAEGKHTIRHTGALPSAATGGALPQPGSSSGSSSDER